MAVILEKSSEEDMRQLILPLLFHSLESNMSQIQVIYSHHAKCIKEFIVNSKPEIYLELIYRE